jgi:hypothetical protein
MSYTCQYCKHSYTKESTLITHSCEKKRRALAKDERHVQLGFMTFVEFFKSTQNSKGVKTYEEFCESPYYTGFVKFGSFVSNVNPLYPEKFIKYVVTSGVKLDHWCNEGLYDQYVVDLLKKENVETALERTIKHMMKWADENNAQWNHYFNYVSLNRATFDIKDGKISPWVILNCKSGKDMVRRFSDEQLSAIDKAIDPAFWVRRFKSLPADVELVKEVAKESNL